MGRTLRKFHIGHSGRLLDIADRVSVVFLSFTEIGRKSVFVGMEEKIIELYTLDQEIASLLRKEVYICCKSFITKPFKSVTI